MAVRGFKVTDAERRSRVGIAVKNLDDLKRKTIEKFKLNNGDIYFQTQDGTIVENDEYFQTLKPQTLLVWVRNGEKAPTDAEIIYKTIREVNDEYLSAGEKVQEFFSENIKNKVFKLAEILKGVDDHKAKFSKKEDHPEWFQGLGTNAKTKEEYMFKRAQDRIRTYYYKTKEELKKNIESPSPTLQLFLNEIQSRLKLNKYHGYYFDRSSANTMEDMKNSNNIYNNNSKKKNSTHSTTSSPSSLCDGNGVFMCQGRWDKDKCLYNPVHKINPYTSKEELIIFQTWNLDHGKERSRSIIPAICDAIINNNNNINVIDIKTIYNDLFGLDNLKIVHIVCHDKGAHNKKAGPYLLNNNDNIISEM